MEDTQKSYLRARFAALVAPPSCCLRFAPLPFAVLAAAAPTRQQFKNHKEKNKKKVAK